MPTILPLDSPDTTLANAGGKALNLAKLARAGLPVPPGFIVTTAAYQSFVAANDLQALINDQLSTVNGQWSIDAAAAAIRAQFAAASVPPDLADQILAAYHALSAFTIQQSPFTNSQFSSPVAVRSSATAEDLPDLSFAGQQDTFLNVVGDQALLEAVVACWSSLWTARAIAYRQRNGITHEYVALAVVVQAMVESESSGVLFTANPLTGKRSEVVIDATFGLGEALVSGQVEPDQYVVDARAGRIGQRRLGAKALAIHGAAGGGVTTVQQDAAAQQALPDAAILDLARLGKRVEQEMYAGQPQDIEWAWAAGQFYLLQSRPITSLYPLPAGMPAEPLQVLFSLNHVQGMLDPFTPLGQDAIARAFVTLATIFGRHFTPQTQRELAVAGERLYINITPALRHAQARNLVRGILGAVEPGAGQAVAGVLDDPRLAVEGSGFSPQTAASLARFLSIVGRRFAAAMRQPAARRAAALRLVDDFIVEMDERSRRARTLAARLALWEDIYSEFAGRISLQLFPPIAAGIGSFYQLRRLAVRTLGSDQLALEAARGLPGNVTTEMDLVLWTVAQVIQADSESAARFAAEDASSLAAAYQARTLPQPAQAALMAFMDHYGMRGLAEIDLGRPRWREDPAHVIQVVQSYVRIDDPELAPDAVFRRGAAAAQTAIDRLAAAMPNPAQARLVRLLASRMRTLAGLREMPKFTIVRIMDIVRRMMLQSGEELVTSGLLARPDDIFFLLFEELQALAAENDERGMMNDECTEAVTRDWQALVAGRRQAYGRELLRRQVPRILLSDGVAFYEGLGADDGDVVLSGSPVSPGVVEGIVHVVFDPRGARLAPGEILVCPGTDPSWTPLFLAAGGLVMEVGGLMTHGSVVAREYGIPAVVGVHQATTRLHDGQRVRVDGTAGRVVVVGGRENGELGNGEW
ncbi:MAG TPA: PEP/pyruvate-binding domain-containing protein [Anaerolineae bacterium]|nr:PEP/pyruvate-binding domain-containing protein [Anaerolineae bacterium]